MVGDGEPGGNVGDLDGFADGSTDRRIDGDTVAFVGDTVFVVGDGEVGDDVDEYVALMGYIVSPSHIKLLLAHPLIT